MIDKPAIGRTKARVKEGWIAMTTGLLVLTLATSIVMLERDGWDAWADPSTVGKVGVWLEGQITGIGSASLDVAGRMLHLHPKVTIRDDEGRTLELKELRAGWLIRYELKEGALHQIIVILPR